MKFLWCTQMDCWLAKLGKIEWWPWLIEGSSRVSDLIKDCYHRTLGANGLGNLSLNMKIHFSSESAVQLAGLEMKNCQPETQNSHTGKKET